MKFKLLILLFLVIFSITFVLAKPDTSISTGDQSYKIFVNEKDSFKQGENYTFYIHADNFSTSLLIPASQITCYVHTYGNGGIELFESHPLPIESNGIEHYAYLSPGNFSYPGTGSSKFWCNSSAFSGTIEIFYDITSSGEPRTPMQLWSRVFLILLSIALVVLIQWNGKRVNYDSWYNKIVQKYQDKNWIKFAFSALGYNLLKNSYMFSYLVGWLGLLILTDLTRFFNVDSALEVLKIVLGIYSWLWIAVIIIFISQVQEWIMGWLKDLQDINWSGSFGGN